VKLTATAIYSNVLLIPKTRLIFAPQLTHTAARSLCDSWDTCFKLSRPRWDETSFNLQDRDDTETFKTENTSLLTVGIHWLRMRIIHGCKFPVADREGGWGGCIPHRRKVGMAFIVIWDAKRRFLHVSYERELRVLFTTPCAWFSSVSVYVMGDGT